MDDNHRDIGNIFFAEKNLSKMPHKINPLVEEMAMHFTIPLVTKGSIPGLGQADEMCQTIP